MIEAISISQAAELMQCSRQFIEKSVSQKKLITRRIPSKKQKGKFVTEILVTSLPVEVQAKLLDCHASLAMTGGDLRPQNISGAPRRSSPASGDAVTITAGRADLLSIQGSGCQPTPGRRVALGDQRPQGGGSLQNRIEGTVAAVTAQCTEPNSSAPQLGSVSTAPSDSVCHPSLTGGEPGKTEKCTAEEILTWYQTLSEPARARVEARRAVLEGWEDLDCRAPLAMTAELDKTLRLQEYCAGHGISIGCFYRWQRAYDRDGLIGLADFRFGSSRSKLTTEQKNYMVALIKQNPDRRDMRIWEYVNQYEDRAGQAPPLQTQKRSISYTTVRRFISAWKEKNHELYTFLRDPDKWKSQYMVAFGSASAKAKHFLHYIEMDSSPADMLCADGSRYNLTGLIDIYSRKVVIKVTPTSNSMSISAALRTAIINWGIPENLVRDNGKDFTSNHINRICNELEITTHTAAPFTPEAKPHIERFFRTIAYDLMEELAGYIGHNVGQRKSIEARRSFAKRFMRAGADPIALSLMPDQLQQIIDSWINNVYHTRNHRGINTTPDIKQAQSTVAVRRVANERALDILLMAEGGAVVSKKGIRYQNGLYQAPELAGWVKSTVGVRRDLDDAGKLYVFNEGGQFVCIARSAALTGMSSTDYAEAKKAQRQSINAQKKAIETLVGEPMAERLKARTKITPFTRQIEADLPALTSAQAAALEAQGIKPERYKSIAEQMESNPPRSPFAKGEELDDSLDWLDDVVIEDEPFIGGGYG